MKQAVKEVAGWVASTDRAARAETNPHWRAILENYRQHVALEFNGRREEFLGPDMAVDEPLYRSRLGTGDVIVADGYKAVLGFYNALNEDTLLTNHDERLAVADWGLASYNTFDIWTTGRHVAELGFDAIGIDPDGCYRIHRPIATFWNYTPGAKLLGEEVYELHPARIDAVAPFEMPTWEEVRDAVKQYLPPAPLRVKQAA